LALSGFRHVEVIDLDTIDVSNLNRQLLFRSQHVGMPKCTVGCEVAKDMIPPLDENDKDLPEVVYKAHHGNVCDATNFHVPFIKQFALVLNALDNVEARRRVNRLCLAANVPLIEAGTTGYLGQVTVIHKQSQIACYECKTQETQKVYPICTIRSTPSMPVHTIVWGKELYKLLFNMKDEDSMLYEPEDGEEPSTYMTSVSKVRKLLWEADTNMESTLKPALQELLKALYMTEIQKQLDMGRYKAAKKTPTPLQEDTLKNGLAGGIDDCTSTTSIWTNNQCVAQIVDCVILAARSPRDEVLGSFDKDDGTYV
jgi:ubiquitin-like 1-activating enzyme E1 B